MPGNNKIIDLIKYKKQKALEVYNRLDPDLKKFVTSTDKDIQALLEKPLDDIPEDIVLALEEERLPEE